MRGDAVRRVDKGKRAGTSQWDGRERDHDPNRRAGHHFVRILVVALRTVRSNRTSKHPRTERIPCSSLSTLGHSRVFTVRGGEGPSIPSRRPGSNLRTEPAPRLVKLTSNRGLKAVFVFQPSHAVVASPFSRSNHHARYARWMGLGIDRQQRHLSAPQILACRMTVTRRCHILSLLRPASTYGLLDTPNAG